MQLNGQEISHRMRLMRFARQTLIFRILNVTQYTTWSLTVLPMLLKWWRVPQELCYAYFVGNRCTGLWNSSCDEHCVATHEPCRCLRSTNGHLLAVPSCVKSSFASRTFCVSSSNNWNSLPAHIRSFDSLVTFQSRLKSHLFSSAYHV